MPSFALHRASCSPATGLAPKQMAAKPPVKPGPMLPVLGVWFFGTNALVKLLSSGLRIDKARRSPGRVFRAAERFYRNRCSVTFLNFAGNTGPYAGGLLIRI